MKLKFGRVRRNSVRASSSRHQRIRRTDDRGGSRDGHDSVPIETTEGPSWRCNSAIEAAKCNFTDCVVGPRRGLSTSRSTMPLINNNSAHVGKGSSPGAMGFADQGTSQGQGEFRVGSDRFGHEAAGFSLSVPRGPRADCSLRRW